jgi:membrane protease YdiL (CAAX protease family)
MSTTRPPRDQRTSGDNGDPGPTRASQPWWSRRRHPVWVALGLVMASNVAIIAIAALSEHVHPGESDRAQLIRRLVAVLVVVLAAILVVARSNGWRSAGAGGPRTWRDTRLLVVPALIALAPLVTGLGAPAASTVAVLIIGYTATGIFEELWDRGVVLDSLRSIGLRRAALIGGALFGASHLTNVAFGQPLAISLAQSIGAFCFGVGFSIMRWRTNAVWLLAAIHAVGDLMFKVTNLHGGVLWGFLVGHDIAMLLWGLWCLHGLDEAPTETPCQVQPARP